MRPTFACCILVGLLGASKGETTPSPTLAPTPAQTPDTTTTPAPTVVSESTNTPAPTVVSGTTETCSASCSTMSCGVGEEPFYALSDGTLTLTCEPCTYNFYKNATGSDECTACDDGMVSGLGATSCVCPALYYMDVSGSCVECPTGVDCTSMGSDISNLLLEAGYWRIDSTSADVLECLEPSACVGGNFTFSSSSSATASRRRLATMYEGDAYCAEGYEGLKCAVCSSNYYAVGYVCSQCDAGNRASKIISIVLLGAAIVIFVLLVLRGQAIKDSTTDGGENGADAMAALGGGGAGGGGRGCIASTAQAVRQKADTLVVKFKILVTHYQMVVQLPAVLDVAFPETFTRFAEAFNVLNFDFWGILSQGCFFDPNFYKQLVSVTFMPVGIILLLFCNYWYRRHRYGGASRVRTMWDKTVSAVLLVTFFFYTAVSTTVLRTFNCEQFDDGGKYLQADFDISCESKRYKAFATFAGVMVLVFPLGVPLLYAGLLYKDRKRLSPPHVSQAAALAARRDDSTLRYTSFLWETYRPRAYLYEVWECVRKLLMTGLLVYFKQGTSTQVVIAILITLVAMRVFNAARPYKRKDENSLAEASMWAMFFTLFGALLIDSGVTEEDGYNEAAVGVILSLLNIGLLVLAVLQTFWTASMWLTDQLKGDSEGEPEQRRPPPPRPVAPAPAKQQDHRRGSTGSMGSTGSAGSAGSAGSTAAPLLSKDNHRSSGSGAPATAAATAAASGFQAPPAGSGSRSVGGALPRPPSAPSAAAAAAAASSRGAKAGPPSAVPSAVTATATAAATATVTTAAATRGFSAGSSGSGGSQARAVRSVSSRDGAPLLRETAAAPVTMAATAARTRGGVSEMEHPLPRTSSSGSNTRLSENFRPPSAAMPALSAVSGSYEERDMMSETWGEDAETLWSPAPTTVTTADTAAEPPATTAWREKLAAQSAWYHRRHASDPAGSAGDLTVDTGAAMAADSGDDRPKRPMSPCH